MPTIKTSLTHLNRANNYVINSINNLTNINSEIQTNPVRLKKRPKIPKTKTELILPFCKESLKLDKKIRFPNISDYYNPQKKINKTNKKSYCVLDESFLLNLKNVEKLPIGDLTTLREVVVSEYPETKSSLKVFLQSRLSNTGNIYLAVQIEYSYLKNGSQHVENSKVLNFLPNEWFNIAIFIDAENYTINDKTANSLNYTIVCEVANLQTLESFSEINKVTLTSNFTRELGALYSLLKPLGLEDKIHILPCNLQNRLNAFLWISTCKGTYHDVRLDYI